MTDHPIENPTYLRDIRFMFTERDMACMTSENIDLRTYEGVKQNALKIFPLVRDGKMPPASDDRRWSEAWVQTFYNWMHDSYPRGVAPQVAIAETSSAKRIRRDITALDPDGEEVAKVAKAFEGMMARDPDHPQSYFNVTGLHWLPGPETWCEHHGDRYNPWHRAYMNSFEDAMRSVEGCEDVTLPYWDIASGVIPKILNAPPFDTYVLPVDVHNLGGTVVLPKGSKMVRNDDATVSQLLERYEVNKDIQTAIGASHWEKFNGWGQDFDGNPIRGGIIAAHDSGHVACGDPTGGTIGNQDLASFDPLFWFFHCNWDRLWWRWQQMYSATKLDDFKTTLIGSADWLTDPVINRLEPFDTSCDQMIDLSAMDIDYEHPAGESFPDAAEPVFAMLEAASGFRVPPSDKLIVRLSGVDRLRIPGGFVVSLLADGELIREQPVFQPSSPESCANCKQTGRVNFRFEVDREAIEGKVLSARIDLGDRSKTELSMDKIGNPKLDVHLEAQEAPR